MICTVIFCLVFTAPAKWRIELRAKIGQYRNRCFKWINDIKNILDDSGFSYLWNSQISPGTQAIKSVIKQRLVDQFYQKLVSEMEQSSRGRFYLTFKIDFNLEKYQTVLKKQDRNIFCRFRCSNLKLPVEIGRWRNIPYENRQCPLCDSREVGDEFHYFFICKNDVIRMLRGKYIPNYYTNNPSAHKNERITLIVQ